MIQVSVPMFYRVRASDNMVEVQDGTLPPGSALAGQTVPAFSINKHEVTWGQWQAVRSWAGTNGYDLSNIGNGNAENHPVRDLNWYHAIKWCNARSEMEGLTPVYLTGGSVYKVGDFGRYGSSNILWSVGANGYRLPTEAEWEWAARGGLYSHGYNYSGSNDVNAVAWYLGNNTPTGTKTVGTKAANELGIFDMSGNVWEWCWDDAAPSGFGRRLRGGSYGNDPSACAVASRGDFGPEQTHSQFGFRVFRRAAN